MAGIGWQAFGAVLRLRAQDSVQRLTSSYGEGCVARIDGVYHAGSLRCPVGGLEVGTSYVDNLPPDFARKLSVNAVVLRPDEARHAQFAVDTFDASGKPTGTFLSGTLFAGEPRLGMPAKVFGPPLGQRFPFIVAIRAARKGESSR